MHSIWYSHAFVGGDRRISEAAWNLLWGRSNPGRILLIDRREKFMPEEQRDFGEIVRREGLAYLGAKCRVDGGYRLLINKLDLSANDLVTLQFFVRKVVVY